MLVFVYVAIFTLWLDLATCSDAEIRGSGIVLYMRDSGAAETKELQVTAPQQCLRY